MTSSRYVPSSHLEICRLRKQITHAHAERDWQSVRDVDHRLSAVLEAATQDPRRDMHLLLKELRGLVQLYKKVVDDCDLSLSKLPG